MGKEKLDQVLMRLERKIKVREKKSKGKGKGSKIKVGQRDIKGEGLGNKKCIVKTIQMKERKCYFIYIKYRIYFF